MKKIALFVMVVLMVVAVTGCNSGGKAPAITSESAKYTDKGYTVNFYGEAAYKREGMVGKYDIYAHYIIRPLVDFEGSVLEIRVQNIKVTKQAKISTMTLDLWQSESAYLDGTQIKVIGAPKSVGKDFVVWNGNDFRNRINIGFKSGYLGTLLLDQNFSGSHDAPWAYRSLFPTLRITADDLRFTVSYQLEITDYNGTKYRKNVEVVVFPGDFLKQSNDVASYTLENYYSEPFTK
ncbi:MAG: hypothetical protein Q8N36_00740 [bacterium]|nr:hypothetical protein [bacterium]